MNHRRSGFTIIELLVVVTIIAILMAISMKVYGSVIEGMRERATRNTLTKIQAMIDARATAFQRRYQKPYTVTSSVERQKIASQMFSGNAADIAARKLLEAKWFPQSGSDLLDVGNVRGMYTLYPNLVTSTGQLINPNVTPAEVFYEFVMQGGSLGNEAVGKSEMSMGQEIGDVNANGLPEFVDGWGNPIRFYRWPTRLFRPQGQTAAAMAPVLTAADLTNARAIISTLPGNIPTSDGTTDIGRDPDDPLRTLWGATQPLTLERMTFPGTSISGPTPSTWWAFMAVSAGPDGVFGMYPPDDTANLGNLGAVRDANDLADDIVSISMKAGGR